MCGGRLFVQYHTIAVALSKFKMPDREFEIAHGGANGADCMADIWAARNNVPRTPFPVSREDWEVYGKIAGPRRNSIMLFEFAPNLVIAFPGNKGTADMTKQALANGIRVAQVNSAGTINILQG